MKTRLAAFLLAAVLLLGSIPAMAAWDEFTDVSGHWAEDFLQVAVEDGIVQGYPDKTIRPDDPILVNEMIVAINRILLPVGQADISAAEDLTPGETWYYADAAKAVNLGLLEYDGAALNIERPATREEIFIMMARAFGMVDAMPDMACLKNYGDLAGMSGEGRRAAASLINRGLVEGFGTALYPERSISRAEFLTLLYRMAYNHVAPAQVSGALEGSISTPAAAGVQSLNLNNLELDENLTLCCPLRYVSLNGVKSSAEVLLRAEQLYALNLGNGTELDTLVLAQRQGSVSIAPYYGAMVNKLVLAEGGGTVSVSGAVSSVELSGEGWVLSISGSDVKSLVIGGSNASVTVNAGAVLDSIVIAEHAENVRLVLNGQAKDVSVLGKKAHISGMGKIENLCTEATAKGFEISVKAENFTDKVDHGLEGVQISLKAPASVEAGEDLTLEAEISGVNLEKTCKLEWFENGKGLGANDFTLKEGALAYHTAEIFWERGMESSFTLGLKLCYGEEELYEEVTVPLNVPDDAWWDAYEAETAARQAEAIATVSSEYKGNYETQYAIDNDYSQRMKIDFVNGKGYKSDTEYLLWINRAYQHVNVFTGRQGNWRLEHSFLCATGKKTSPTPVGVYKTTYKQVGWYTASYTVKPVVRFKTGSGYAFHSRIYYPGTRILSEPDIGYPASAGCIRMYDEDIQWIYDYIPSGTTVVVF